MPPSAKKNLNSCAVRFVPSELQARFPAGTPLLTAIHKSGLVISTLCGGAGICGKCLIRLLQGELAITAADQEALSASQLTQGFRLACTAVLQHDCVVEIPNDKTGTAAEILTRGLGRTVSPNLPL